MQRSHILKRIGNASSSEVVVGDVQLENLFISDDGIGSPENKAKERFALGIGLANVRKIIEWDGRQS